MVKSRRTKTRKRRNKSSGGFATLIAIICAIVALIALVGAGAYLALNTEDEVALNDDLCPKRGARATVAILLDTTDELAQVTKTEVKSRILDVQRTLERYYRVSVYTLSEDGLNPTPIASICNPGRLEQMDKLAQQGLTANPAMIARKYSEFETSISNSINSVYAKKFEAAQSPLLSSLQELNGLMPEPVNIDQEFNVAGKNQIIFVTDLLEHTDVFSNYRSGINIAEYESSRAREKYGRSYEDIDLKFWIVGRNKGNFTTMELMNFWAQIFSKDFNSLPIFQRLPGEI